MALLILTTLILLFIHLILFATLQYTVPNKMKKQARLFFHFLTTNLKFVSLSLMINYLNFQLLI